MREWLKIIRKSKKLTMKQVSVMAGISESHYSCIESGKRGKALKVDLAKAIAKPLGFDWTRFYE